MSNILAGIGLGQMEVIDHRVTRRREIYALYREALSRYEGISFLDEPDPNYFSNRWLTTILVNPKKAGTNRLILQAELEKHNIESRPLWKPMHLQPVFASCPSYTNGLSEEYFNTGLCLPSGSNMAEKDIDRVIDVFIKCLQSRNK
jgi:dTDP-4-amino-4,6-dideoxygalactose transaminase